MSEERWIELEFTALRKEILSLAQAERSAVKFFLPAAAAVYTVPYLLIHQQHVGSTNAFEASEAYLWTLCVAVAGLLVLAMVQSLFWSVDGVRRLGMYIKEGIEPRTNGGLRWEAVGYRFDQTFRYWPGETFTIASSAVLANVVAAVAAGLTFLKGNERLLPIIASAIFAGLALPSLWRIFTSAAARQRYAANVAEIIGQATLVKSESPGSTKAG